MKFVFTKPAKDELFQSIEYYENQELGLGSKFADQVFEAIDRIIEYPKGWTVLDDTFNRCLVKQFPYALIYTLMDEEIIITAVMNLHRKPDYWRNH